MSVRRSPPRDVIQERERRERLGQQLGKRGGKTAELKLRNYMAKKELEIVSLRDKIALSEDDSRVFVLMLKVLTGDARITNVQQTWEADSERYYVGDRSRRMRDYLAR